MAHLYHNLQLVRKILCKTRYHCWNTTKPCTTTDTGAENWSLCI